MFNIFSQLQSRIPSVSSFHGKDDRLLLSGTMVRKTLSEGGELPAEFSRPEVVKILQEYYQGLEEKVEIKLHGAATGEVK